MKIIAVSNPKGGVGKTTTTINLAASLAILDKKVLIIEMDPNGTLSTGLGLETGSIKSGLFGLILGTIEVTEAIQHHKLKNLHIIPCNVNSNEQETRFASILRSKISLKTKIDDIISKWNLDYDFILMDTPPILNEITISALYAAKSVLIPLQCSYYAINVVERLIQMVQRIRNGGNPELKIEGILLNFYEKNTRFSRKALSEAKLLFKDLMLNTIIPKNATDRKSVV